MSALSLCVQSSRNRFQGILITDGTASYAVFIYECANMMWGGGVIGWQESPSNYVAHQLSGKNNSNSIACLSGETHTAIIYRICKFKLNAYLYMCYPAILECR